MPWSATVTSWLGGPFHFIALILRFSIWKPGMASAPRLDGSWGQMLSCRLAVPCLWPRVGGRAQAPGPAEGCVDKGCWARWVSWPLPGRGSPVREAFPARGQQRVREQEALGGTWAPLAAPSCPGRGVCTSRGRGGQARGWPAGPDLRKPCSRNFLRGARGARQPHLLGRGGGLTSFLSPGLCRKGPRILAPSPWHPQSPFQGLAVFSPGFRCPLYFGGKLVYTVCP